ncbi:glycosyltransferase [Salinibacter altiplanensis]|uniref:glycosyltransferase n=1 Tax=Salinibacter altiplanensis TaxID=1803181 RepID=UPI00131A1761|nr:glycosyltransferase [Salinibacter altiplanensis]
MFERLLACRDSKEIVAVYRPDLWVDPTIEKKVDVEGIDLIPKPKEKSFGNVLREVNPDRFYTALPYSYHDVDFSGIEVVMTIHGLRPMEMPTDRFEYRYERSLRGWGKYAVKQLMRSWYVRQKWKERRKLVTLQARQKTIVVPSNHTKYALLDAFEELDGDEVRVFYSPTRRGVNAVERATLEEKGIEPGGYILLVSGGRWIKNAYRGVQALDTLFERRPEIDLDVVITGVEHAESIFGRLNNRDRFQFLDYVERPFLEGLYKHAFCLLYPTLNEGFGYPPLEAMRYETPVLCSAVTSLPEICRDAAFYFNPYSQREVRNRVLTLFKNEAVYRDYTERAHDRYATVARQQKQMLDDLCALILAG